jgi:hypothetical protein
MSHSSVMGILSVGCVGGRMVMEFNYDGGCLCTVSSLHEDSVSKIKLDTIKTKGISVIAHEVYISETCPKHFIILDTFSL